MAVDPSPDKVILIPRTFPSPAHLHAVVALYKNLRLQGLQVDREAFSSTYERESQFPLDEWIARIQNPVGKTFVSVFDDNKTTRSFAELSVPAGDNSIADTNLRLLLSKEWMGQLSLIGPELLSAQGENTALDRPWEVFQNYVPPTTAKREPLSGAHVVYMLVGMFVLPQARRRGNGQRLLEAAVNAACEEAKARGALTARIVISVEQGNGVAQRLYERVGFEVWDDVAELNSRRQSSCVAMVKVIDITEIS